MPLKVKVNHLVGVNSMTVANAMCKMMPNSLFLSVATSNLKKNKAAFKKAWDQCVSSH